MTKKELREQYITKRNEISQAEKYKLDDLILIQFQTIALSGDMNMLLSFWPIESRNEVNTHSVIDFLMFRNPGLQVAYPVSNYKDHTMKAVLTSDDTEFVEKKHAIMEPLDGEEIAPKNIDIILLPLLAFDKNGYRLGYGKGFYDRYLATCKKDVLKIGFSYFEPVHSIDEVHTHDIKLDYCITPEAVYQFPNSPISQFRNL
jgi:5-formyltetrahydrofolate cyclo-ligase